MMDLIAGLAGFALLVFVFAAIGHALWLLGASICKAIIGEAKSSPKPALPLSPCRACGAKSGVIGGQCCYCGAIEAGPAKLTLTQEIEATLKQLERLYRRGIVSDAEYQRMQAACRRDLDRLAGREVPLAPPASAPATAQAATAPAPTASMPQEPAPRLRQVVNTFAPPVIDAEIVETTAQPKKMHPLDQPDEPIPAPAPAVPSQPRRALADVLSAFMQERNIRWGELVSGLLIVGSAAGLVISLRATLRDWIPYFPALLFLLGTAAIHSAGLYTLKRWNLRSTSRGVLIISQLLVPLNFLAAIVISGHETQLPVTSLAYIAAVSIGLLAYSTICYTAAQALFGGRWFPTALAVMGASASQLYIHRLLVTPEVSQRTAIELALLPVGSFCVAMLAALARARQWRTMAWTRASELLMPLGLGSFALLMPLLIIITRSAQPWTTIADLAPLLALIGAAVVSIGTFITTRTKNHALAALATTGTALAIGGGLGMLGAVVLAWPDPTQLVLVGALCTAALTLIAVLGRLPVLHAPALACATLAVLVGYHQAIGSFAEINEDLGLRIWNTWQMGRSAVVLAALATLVGGAAAALWRWRRQHDALYYAGSAAGLVVLSCLIAARSGFLGGVDASLATLVFGYYAAGATVALFVRPHRYVASAAAALLLVTGVHALGFNPWIQAELEARQLMPDRPVVLMVLAQALVLSLFALLAKLWRARPSSWQKEVLEPLTAAALVESFLATPFAVLVAHEHFGRHAGYTFAVAAVWIISAIIYRMPQLVTMGQAILSLVLVFATTAWLQQQAWWDIQAIDARSVYVVAAVLAVWCAGWAVTRRATESLPRVRELIDPPWPAVDQFVLGALVVVLLSVPGLASWKNVDAELATHSFQFAAPMEVLHLANSPLVWLAWGLAIVALVASLWERLNLPAICGLLLLGITPCMVLAIDAHTELASASMLRWSLAAYGLIATTIICLRSRIKQATLAVPGLVRGELPPYSTAVCIGIVTLRSALPVIGLTLTACSLAAQGIAPHGPLADTFFKEIGWSWSYGTPLSVLVLVSLLLALRERQAGFMLAGSVIFQMVATLACVMPVLTSGGTFTIELAAQVLQYNAVALGVFALVWQGLQPWLERSEGDRLMDPGFPPLLMLQIGALLASLLGLAGWATGLVLLAPEAEFSALAVVLASTGSFVALGVGLVAAIWYAWRYARGEVFTLGMLLGLSLVALVAVACRGYYFPFPWISRHVLIGGWLLLAAISTALACWLWDRKWRGTSNERLGRLLYTVAGWALALIGVVLIHVTLTGGSDLLPAWPVGEASISLFLLVVLGIFSRSHVLAYVTTPVALLTTTLAWHAFWPSTANPLSDFIAINMLGALVINAWWLGWEIFCQRALPQRLDSARLFSPPIVLTPVLSIAFTAFIFLCLPISFLARTFRGPHAGIAVTGPNVVLTIALAAYLLTTLWHSRVRTGVWCLYLWGLCVTFLICDSGEYSAEWMVAILGMATSAYIALTGVLWQGGAHLALAGQKLGIEEPIKALTRTSRWLPVVTLNLAAAIVLLEFFVVLDFKERLLRLGAGFAPVLLAIGVGLQAQQARRATMAYVSILLATIAAVYLSWADLPPGDSATLWLERAIRVLVVLGSLAMVYGGLLTRVWAHLADWATALWKMAITSGIGAGLALVAILAMEVGQFVPGQDSLLATPQVLVVAAVLTLLSAALVSLAIAPPPAIAARWLPTDAHRMACVYAAQIVLALAFGHLYLTRPTWFDGFLRPYWPFIVMALAFIGVGLGEWFDRLKLRVLADPLRRSGVLLPLIPAIGWWIESLRGEPTTDYALVMFVVGLLYVMFSVCRQSMVGAVAAGVSGNIALWSLMHDRGLNFVAHPQFWLIPPAVLVLAAVQVQAKRLNEEQIAAARYVCLLAIYLSSTSEIFITGIGDSLWPPIVLASLAVIGVLAGIVFQVRAFLYLGTGFVFLAMVTMVWHAARSLDHVWPWWAFGICLGLAILTFFGMFEKKKVEITALVERLRQWEH